MITPLKTTPVLRRCSRARTVLTGERAERAQRASTRRGNGPCVQCAREQTSRPAAPPSNARPARPRLALRTAVRRPVHEHLTQDRCAAPAARLVAPAVGGQRSVEVAAVAVDV